MESKVFLKEQSIGYLRRLNYHCRQYCLRFVEIENPYIMNHFSRSLPLGLGFSFKNGKFRYVGQLRPGSDITQKKLFELLYGFFVEDRCRMIFFVFPVVRIDISEFLPNPCHLKLSTNFFPHGSRHAYIDFLFAEGIETRKFSYDCTELTHFHHFTINNTPHVNEFIDSLRNMNYGRGNLVSFKGGESVPAKSISFENYTYLMRRTRIVSLRSEIYESEPIRSEKQQHEPIMRRPFQGFACQKLYLKGPMKNFEARFSHSMLPMLQNCRKLFLSNLKYSDVEDVNVLFHHVNHNVPLLQSFSFINIKIDNEEVVDLPPFHTLLFENKSLRSLEIDLNRSMLSDALDYTNSILTRILFRIPSISDSTMSTDQIEILKTFLPKFMNKHNELKSFGIGCVYGNTISFLSDIKSFISSKITTLLLYFPLCSFSEGFCKDLLKISEQLRSLRVSLINFSERVTQFFSMSNLEELYINHLPKDIFSERDMYFNRYKRIHLVTPEHLQLFEKNMKKLKRIVMMKFPNPFFYFILYSKNLRHIEYFSNGITEIDRSEDIFEIKKNLEEEKKKQHRLWDEFFHSWRIKKCEEDVDSSEQCSEEEQTEYLKKSIKKWKLLPPYTTDSKYVRWKHYYEQRIIHEKMNGQNISNNDFYVEDVELKLKDENDYQLVFSDDKEENEKFEKFRTRNREEFDRGIGCVLFNFIDDEVLSEEEKEKILSSTYIIEMNLGWSSVEFRIIYYSIFGDGMRYKFSYERTGKPRYSHNEHDEFTEIENINLASRRFPFDSNFVNYRIMPKNRLKHFGYMMFNQYLLRRENKKEIRLEDLFRLFYAMTGGYSEFYFHAGDSFLDRGWGIVEAKRVYKFDDVEFTELHDDDDCDFSSCVIDNIVGCEGLHRMDEFRT